MGSEAQSLERQLSSKVDRAESRMRKSEASQSETDMTSTSRAREGTRDREDRYPPEPCGPRNQGLGTE